MPQILGKNRQALQFLQARLLGQPDGGQSPAPTFATFQTPDEFTRVSRPEKKLPAQTDDNASIERRQISAFLPLSRWIARVQGEDDTTQ